MNPVKEKGGDKARETYTLTVRFLWNEDLHIGTVRRFIESAKRMVEEFGGTLDVNGIATITINSPCNYQSILNGGDGSERIDEWEYDPLLH